MVANTYILVCVLGLVSFVSCQDISCYDCDPRNFGSDCGDPESNAVRNVRCVPEVVNGTAICLSAFLQYRGSKENETGIYRGCKTLRPDVRDFCDWFVEEYGGENLTIPSCVPCNTTRCNTARFNDDGSNGAISISTTIAVLTINALLVLLISIFG